MKLKNIALGIGFLAAMFSCSMEDDIIQNDNGMNSVDGEEVYAALQFNISSKTELVTKSSSVSGPTDGTDNDVKNNEMAVNHCFVFVADGDAIIGSRHYTSPDMESSDGKYTLKKHILVKVPKNNQPTLKVYVVGMKSDNGSYFETNIFSKATSLNALKSSVVGKNAADEGNSLSDFIKVGEGVIYPYDATIHSDGYQSSDKTTQFECNGGEVKCGNADITLALRAAAIEIASFKIKDSKGNYSFDSETANSASATREVVKDIQLGTKEEGKGGQIVNTVLDAGEATSKVRSYTSYLTGYNEMSAEEKEKSNPMGYRFYTYQNTVDATMITIPYVNGDGKEQSISFSVKTPDTSSGNGYSETVKAGYLYRINVEITNNVANVTVQCYTQDWEEGGSYDIVLKPSNN